MANCTFSRNRAEQDGGGVFSAGNYEFTVSNCTFSGNRAERDGAAMYNEARSNLRVANCTFSGNQADRTGGAIYSGDSIPTLTNCILWTNTPDEIYVARGNLVVTFSNVQGGWSGKGNIDADPLFVQGPRGDFYLSQRECGQGEDSPCLDAGKGKARKLGLQKFTTCTKRRKDKKRVDMGYHYPTRR